MKEYLDESGAANFMCVSKATFNKNKDEWGVKVYRLPGVSKNVYKVVELHGAMEKLLKWQPSTKEVKPGISIGAIQQASTELASRNTTSPRSKKRKTTA